PLAGMLTCFSPHTPAGWRLLLSGVSLLERVITPASPGKSLPFLSVTLYKKGFLRPVSNHIINTPWPLVHQFISPQLLPQRSPPAHWLQHNTQLYNNHMITHV